MPFVFDRLERVTNDFVDFHSNEARPDFVLTLPPITFRFPDNLNEDTRRTLPTVERLHLCDLGPLEDRSCRRLFCLTPNLDHLTLDSEDLLQVIDAVKSQYKPFNAIRQLTVLESVHRPFADRQIVTQHFLKAIVTYRERSFSNQRVDLRHMPEQHNHYVYFKQIQRQMETIQIMLFLLLTKRKRDEHGIEDLLGSHC